MFIPSDKLILSVLKRQNKQGDVYWVCGKYTTYKGNIIVPNLYYLEIEAWLSRMESWQARLRPVGATQDILEQQSREVKVTKNVVIIPHTVILRSRTVLRNVL